MSHYQLIKHIFLNLHNNTNKQNLQRKTRPQWSKNLVNISKLNFFFMLAPLTYILYAQSHCGHRRTLMPSRLANHFNHLWYVSRTIKSICSWDVHTCTCISRCYQQTCLIRFSTKHSCFVETDYKRLRNALWEKLFIGQVYK